MKTFLAKFLCAMSLCAFFVGFATPRIVHASSSTTNRHSQILENLRMSSSVFESLLYLSKHQDLATSGIFEESDNKPSPMLSGWTAVAFGSAGYNPNSVGGGIVNYIQKDACSLTSATDIERTILAVSAAGLSASNFGGCDLLAKLDDLTNINTGVIGDGLVSSVFGVLAVRSQDKLVNQSTTDYIVNAQADDGGWSSGWGTEANITAQTIMALASANYNKSSPSIVKAKQYLKNLQTDSGGIKYDTNGWTTEPDAFSDAYTLQAIYALGEDPRGGYWTVDGKSIIDDLSSLRQADGSYNFSQSFGAMNPVYTTAIVLPALLGKPMPVVGENLTEFNLPAVEQKTPQPAPPTSDNSKTAKSADIASATTQTTSTPTIEDHTRGNVASTTSKTTTLSPVQNQKIDTAPITSPPNSPDNRNYTLILVYSGGLLLGIALSFILSRAGVLPVFVLMTIIVPSTVWASQAGVVVRHGSGNTIKRCVNFDTASITGLELLQKAGLSPVLENGFVVSVDGERAKSSNEAGVKDDYWSYWQNGDNGWTYSRAGAQWQKARDGDVQGWQRGGSTLLLPLIKFDDICAKKSEGIAVATQSTPSPSPPSGILGTGSIRGRESGGASDTKSSSPATASTTAPTTNQNSAAVSPQTDTKSDHERTNYTNVYLFAGLSIAGFGLHRLFRRMWGNK